MLGIGLSIILAIAYSAFINQRLVLKYNTAITSAHNIISDAALGHLWLEEIIAGDSHQNIEHDVWRHLDKVEASALALQSFERLVHTADDPSIKDGLWTLLSRLEASIHQSLVSKDISKSHQYVGSDATARTIEIILNDAKIFRAVAMQRYAFAKSSEAQANKDVIETLDTQMDSSFNRLIDNSFVVKDKIMESIQHDLHLLRVLQYSFILFLVLMLLIAFLVMRNLKTSENQTSVAPPSADALD